MTTPWWHSTTIYQIYPRSFADSDGDGIGDLRGIIERLDHLVDLGVGTVWLSPFFVSPQRDFGYDVADYCDVAPEYGTLADAEELIEAAHSRGLRVMFDLVLNHTSDEHPWFVESRSSRDNPRADWYLWRDSGRRRNLRGRKVPNNWRSIAEVTSGWHYAAERDQWYFASFLPFQPDLNWNNPDVRDAMFDSVRFWLDRDVDGFRLDMFGDIMKDPTFANAKFRPRIENGFPQLYDRSPVRNRQANVELARDLRRVVAEYDHRGAPVGDGPHAEDRERLLLGEMFGSAETLRRYMGVDNDGLQLVFLFGFLSLRYDADWLLRCILDFESEFPFPAEPTYVLENHDRSRLMGRVGGDIAKAKVLATVMLTLRGVPTIYQGQEIGQSNTYIPLRDAKDPIVATYFPWLPEAVNRMLPERLNRDEVRTPMQWDPSDNAGFSAPGVAPWLPVNEDRRVANVESQSGDPDSLLELYRRLFHLRCDHRALSSGRLDVVAGAPAGTVAWLRSNDTERMLVAVNMDDEARVVPTGGPGELLLATDPAVRLTGGGNGTSTANGPNSDTGTGIHLVANSAAVIRLV